MSSLIRLSQNSTQLLIRWYSEEILNKTQILNKSIFGLLFGWFGQAAVTINKTVHLTKYAGDLDSKSGAALVGHELFHVVQQQQMGWWGFLVRYLWNWRPKHIKHGEEHPMEKAAYERQREIETAFQE